MQAFHLAEKQRQYTGNPPHQKCIEQIMGMGYQITEQIRYDRAVLLRFPGPAVLPVLWKKCIRICTDQAQENHWKIYSDHRKEERRMMQEQRTGKAYACPKQNSQ